MKRDLSIIIPFFNAKLHLEGCLASVLGQLTERVELILVDDGSTDNGFEVIERVSDKQLAAGSVKLLRQPNSGPGGARNSGLDVAQGRYVGFLDSDDVLSPRYVRAISKIIEAHNPDIIQFPFRRFRDGEPPLAGVVGGRVRTSGWSYLEAIYPEIFAQGTWFPCTRVFRRTLFDERRFPAGVHYEDLMTIPFVFLDAKSIFFCGEALLGYRKNPASITSTHTRRQLNDIFQFFSSLDASLSLPHAILKLRTARTVAYFATEIGECNLELDKAVDFAREMTLPADAVQLLSSVDRAFYRWPAVFAIVERLRLPAKSVFSKFRGV